jgi:phosphatidate cytidylyltransferase
LNVLQLSREVQWVLAGIGALLVVATLVTCLLKVRNPGSDYRELTQRIHAWWVMVAIFAVALGLGERWSIAFFAFVSFLALKEYLSLIPTRRADRRVIFWAYLTIPVQYWWVAEGYFSMFTLFIPVWGLFIVSTRMVLVQETHDFLRAVGTLQWGMMTMVFALSHVAYLLVLPAQSGGPGDGASLVVYLVLLTEFNDVAQYVWGKTFGKHKVVPKVSPGKTVEGLAGGIVTTTGLAVLLAPWLTPLDRWDAVAAGLLIGMGGFLGDITISSVKRDIGVKDSGTMIAGHGGVLDRVNSLMATAPLFFHFIRFFYY